MYTFTNLAKQNIKSFLLSAFIVSSTHWAAMAQPVITSEYITGTLNQTFRHVLYETDLNINSQLQEIINADGANQVWDFRDLNYIDSTVTIEVYMPVDPNDPLLNNPNLAGSNLIWKFSALPVQGGSPDTVTQYRYGSLDNGDWIERGAVSFIDIDSDQMLDTILTWFSPPSLMVPFPVTQNSFWTDSTTLVQNFQGMEFTSATIIDTTRVTGWGTVITPAGSGEALRLAEKSINRSPGNPFVAVSNDLDFVTADGISASIVLEDGRAFYSRRTNLDVMTPVYEASIPNAPFNLHQSYPNPFNQKTSIPFSLDQAERARLRVIDLMGKERTIIADQVFQAGAHQLDWSPGELESGTYILEMKVGGMAQHRRIVIQ